MQVGESVSPEIIADVNHDDDCFFCNSKEDPKEEENDLKDDYPEDDDLDGLVSEGIKFKNMADKLGTALGGKPDAMQVSISTGSDINYFDVSVAAHHLIPGNASLKQSLLFDSEEYLWKDGKAKGNICYNINSGPNGAWLPGNYAIRPWGTKGAAFFTSTGIDPEEYAFASIDIWNAQFHDAHENYSNFVLEVLDKIYDKLKANEMLWCPEAKKEDKKPDERSPLYVLVNRLHTVSSRMRKMLVFPKSNWKKNIFTSSFSLAYMIKK